MPPPTRPSNLAFFGDLRKFCFARACGCPRGWLGCSVRCLALSLACPSTGSGNVGGGGIGSSDIGGRGSASGDVGSSGRGGGGVAAAAAAAAAAEAKIPNGERYDHCPHFPESGSTCKGIHSKEKKAEKVYFYLRHKNCNIANLAPIFSDARSGTIANKNQKRITAGTQWNHDFIFITPIESP